MATMEIGDEAKRAPRSLAPDPVEKAVAVGALAMLVAMVVALAIGFHLWTRIPVIVWLHMLTIAAALLLTPLLMLRQRGTRWHRRAGWAWCIAMAATAALSLFIGGFSNGRWSLIHILSAFTLLGVYGVVRNARAHRVSQHRATVRAISIGALLVAGFLTLLPTRTLGHLLFG